MDVREAGQDREEGKKDIGWSGREVDGIGREREGEGRLYQ